MPAWDPTEVVRQIRVALGAGVPLVRDLPPDGRVRVERWMPLVAVAHAPAEEPERDAATLVTPQAAYAVVPSGENLEASKRLVGSLLSLLAGRCGAVCVVEVCLATLDPTDRTTERHTASPLFRGWLDPDPRWAVLGDDLREVFRGVRVEGHEGRMVSVEQSSTRTLTDCPPVVDDRHTRGHAVCWLGLEVQPIFRDSDTGALYPTVREELRGVLGRALCELGSRFARRFSRLPPSAPPALARWELDEAELRVDATLVDVAKGFDFLVQLTPSNLRDCWRELASTGFDREPSFEYRPLSIDPALLKRRLFEPPIEAVEDPLVAALLREKQEELDRQLSMLRDRGDAFLYESLQLFGYPDDDLVALAELVLEETEIGDGGPEDVIGATEFLELIREEALRYRLQAPRFPVDVELRDDIAAGVMVVRGRLLVNPEVRVPMRRAEALVAHEVGTHVVTWFNGMRQPLKLFGHGLARYGGTQEGLAVLAEWLRGGLTTTRLRILGARVIAARDVAEGASFVDLFRKLTRDYGLTDRAAFQTVVRALRGGGMTKDMGYLDGFACVLDHLRTGGELGPLYSGKLALHHLPQLEELLARGVLSPPAVRPPFLDDDLAQARLADVRASRSVHDLLCRMTRELAGEAEGVEP